MIQPFLWGAAASSSLLAGGALELYLRPSRRMIGLVLFRLSPPIRSTRRPPAWRRRGGGLP